MSPEQIEDLWTLCSETWGAKFFDQYGLHPNNAWKLTLVNADFQAIVYALGKIINQGSAFPPTLPEFIAWAKTYRPVPSPDDPMTSGAPLLTSKPIDREKLKAALDEIRASLKKA